MKVALEVLVVGESVLHGRARARRSLSWAAVKDGQANDAVRSRIVRRHWPRRTA